jgi:hypothetical protein
MTNNNLCLEETIEALAIGLSDSEESTLLFLTLRIDGENDSGKDLSLIFSRQSENALTISGASVPMSAYFDINTASFSGSNAKSLILTSLFVYDVESWPAKISELLMSIAEKEQYGDPSFSIVHAKSIKGVVRCVGRDTVNSNCSMYKVLCLDSAGPGSVEDLRNYAFNSTD